MRFSLGRLALVAVLTTLVVAPLSIATAQQSSDVRVDLNLKDADMMAATQILFQRTGIQFVVEPSSKPYNKISLKLEGATPEEAVRYICQAAGAYFRRDENGVFIISQTAPVVEPAPVVPKSSQPRTLKKIRVLKADAKSIYEQIMFSIPFDSARGFEDLKRFVRASSPGNLAGSYGPSMNLQNVQMPNSTFQPINAPNQSMPLTGVESGNDVALPGEGAGQGNLGGRGGGGGLGGQGGGGVQMQGGTGLIGDSIDYISYDPNDNSFVVRGDEDDINQLQTYINMFDVAPRQVQVKVEFITTTDTMDKSLGFEFLFQRGTVAGGMTPGAFIRASDPVFLNYATGNITGRMRAALSEANGKVVQAPILRTLNNQPAQIQSSIQTTIFLNQTVVSNGTVITTLNPVPLSASTFLAIAPRINDDNTITMFLFPQIASFVGVSRGPDGSEIPNIVQQSISVVARVRNGETIVLGGLNNLNEDVAVNRVPVLSDIPIIGQFFRSTRRNKTSSELLIFVTPTILDEDTTAGPGGP